MIEIPIERHILAQVNLSHPHGQNVENVFYANNICKCSNYSHLTQPPLANWYVLMKHTFNSSN